MLISSSLRPSLSQEVPRYPSMFMINSKLITFSYSHVSHKKCYRDLHELWSIWQTFWTRKFKNKFHSPKWTIFTGNRWALSSETETHNLICRKGNKNDVKCFLAFHEFVVYFITFECWRKIIVFKSKNDEQIIDSSCHCTSYTRAIIINCIMKINDIGPFHSSHKS